MGFDGSIEMPLMKRPGVESVSIRSHTTFVGSAASAFVLTNRRPVRVAAQSVPLLDGARSVATT